MIRTEAVMVSNWVFYRGISFLEQYAPTSCLSALLLAAISWALMLEPSEGTLSKAPKLIAVRIAAFCAVCLQSSDQYGNQMSGERKRRSSLGVASQKIHTFVAVA
jgi:membrane-anchored protein YejM (alkaline phosphatase superfamily)